MRHTPNVLTPTERAMVASGTPYSFARIPGTSRRAADTCRRVLSLSGFTRFTLCVLHALFMVEAIIFPCFPTGIMRRVRLSAPARISATNTPLPGTPFVGQRYLFRRRIDSTSDQPPRDRTSPPNQIRPLSFSNFRLDKRTTGPACLPFLVSEQPKNVIPILPLHLPLTHDHAAPGESIAVKGLHNRHDPGTHGIQVDIADQFGKTLVLVADDGFIPVLKPMPVPTMPTIEVDGIPGKEPTHKTRKQFRAAADEQVCVVAEKGPGIHDGTGVLCSSPESLNKGAAIRSVFDDLPLFNPPYDNMVQGSRCIKSRLPRHVRPSLATGFALTLARKSNQSGTSLTCLQRRATAPPGDPPSTPGLPLVVLSRFEINLGRGISGLPTIKNLPPHFLHKCKGIRVSAMV